MASDSPPLALVSLRRRVVFYWLDSVFAAVDGLAILDHKLYCDPVNDDGVARVAKGGSLTIGKALNRPIPAEVFNHQLGAGLAILPGETYG